MANNSLVAFNPLANEDYYKKIISIIDNMVCPPFHLFAIFGNMISIVVFVKMRLKDSVTISFFILALSDLASLITDLVALVFFGLDAYGVYQTFAGNSDIVAWLVATYEIIFVDFSTIVTTYIGVTRCCCVAMALKFKHTFTVARTAWFLIAAFILNLAQKMPIILAFDYYWKRSWIPNITHTGAWNEESIRMVYDMYNIFNLNVFAHLTTIVNVICLFILAYNLYVASRKRQMMTTATGRSILTKSEEASKKEDDSSKSATENQASTGSRVLAAKDSVQMNTGRAGVFSRKDLQVIKVTLLVCATFVAYRFYYAGHGLARLIRPEIDLTWRHPTLYNVFVQFGYVVYFISAGANFIIYLNFNSAYRQVFMNMFSCCCCCKNPKEK